LGVRRLRRDGSGKNNNNKNVDNQNLEMERLTCLEYEKSCMVVSVLHQYKIDDKIFSKLCDYILCRDQAYNQYRQNCLDTFKGRDVNFEPNEVGSKTS